LERRLAAILAADMVGYSRLMAADEARTLARHNAHRRELIDLRIDGYGGRVVKSTGDGLLAEFPSIVDALCCAVTIQLAMAERETAVPEENRIAYRIGINLGDIIIEGNDIYGDGVNVAARLEALADPGGICVSRTVVDQVRGKVRSEFEDQGEQRVKNIPRPLHVFRVLMQPEATGNATAQIKHSSRWQRLAAFSTAVIVIAVIGYVVWQSWVPAVQPASVERMAFALPEKPSIAVLPFHNMSEDTSQEYFADGMTEDLITDLSKVSGLFVIARNSSFAYKGVSAKIKNVAEDLGVRYVLEGSIRRVGDQLRVNAQLIDATTGGHLWADRFDGNATDIFAVQDQVVFKIVKALELKLSESEKREIGKQDTEQIQAREAFQRGWDLYSRFNEQDNAKAVSHFETAVELDPEYGRAYGALALVYLKASIFGWQRAMGKTRAQISRELVPHYLKQARQYPTALVHVVAAMKHLFYWDHGVPMTEINDRGTEEARIEAGYAVALQPNDPEAHITMAWALVASGKPEEGLNFVQAAMRLDPNYPSHYVYFRAAAHYAMGDLKQAAGILRDGMKRDSRANELAPFAASIYAQLGLRQEAREAIETWRPGASQTVLEEAADEYDFPIKWVDEHRWVSERLSDGLRTASLPLYVTVTSLTAKMDQGDPLAQVRTIRAIGWFGSAAASAVPALIELLSADNKLFRREAAIALGKIGPDAEAAVPALTALTDLPIIGFHAKEALQKIVR